MSGTDLRPCRSLTSWFVCDGGGGWRNGGIEGLSTLLSAISDQSPF